MAQININNCTIKIKDGTTPTPNEIAVSIGEGNVTFSEKKTREYINDRNSLDEVRDAPEEPMDVSIDAKWDYLVGSSTSGADPSIREALDQTGNASTWISTDSDACRPYAVDIEIHNDTTPSTCGDEEVITLPDFRWETRDLDLRAGTIAISGKCNATTATVVRQSNS